ncbi:MAG: hypothetical protein AAF630_01500 [Cyanobacteria bacterium P01_C01_bin.38]
MVTTIFCAFCAWAIVILAFASFCLMLNKGTNHLKKLHNIPCSGCDFFTNDYRLKCTIHPSKACSEEAIGCIDFEVKTVNCNACQKHRRVNKLVIAQEEKHIYS